MSPWLWIGVTLASVAFVFVVLAIRWRRRHAVTLGQAREMFQRRREWLEAQFVTRASGTGSPRGLRWADCDFEDRVAYARDRRTGRFRALVGVSIRFEAVEGGGMEEVEAVQHRKAATVVFRLDGPEWEADSRAYFNLNPAQTIEHHHGEMETVE